MLAVSLAAFLFAQLPPTLRASQYSPELHLSLTVGFDESQMVGLVKLPSHGNQNGSPVTFWFVSPYFSFSPCPTL